MTETPGANGESGAEPRSTRTAADLQPAGGDAAPAQGDRAGAPGVLGRGVLPGKRAPGLRDQQQDKTTVTQENNQQLLELQDDSLPHPILQNLKVTWTSSSLCSAGLQRKDGGMFGRTEGRAYPFCRLLQKAR